MKDYPSIREKANLHFKFKIYFNVVLFILGAALVMFLLNRIQVRSELNKQREFCEESLSDAVELLDMNRTGEEELTRVYHEENQDMVESLSRYVLSKLAPTLATADHKTRSGLIDAIMKRTNIEYLFLLDEDGKVELSPKEEHTGIDPVKYGLLTEENLQTLLRGTERVEGHVIPVQEDNQYGKFYFYSVPCRYAAGQYVLVLGASASILDLQIETLRNVAGLMDSVIIENNGFLFSVDPKTGNFLYYDDGISVLSGTSAAEAGLSQTALQNGYAGSQTVNGVSRYVVSRVYNDGIVLCAAADKADIFASNRHVLFWSNMGFITTMLLCLAYAVITRNDFVRRTVETDKFVFRTKNGRNLYFNRTIFKRIVPLALICVMAIFAITFYTQTLYEISESIDRSNATLKELTTRETSDAKSRQMVQDYYDEHFLSRARFIAYLLEEDASFLNEYSNRIHTYYDKDGTKVYLKDDYGNWLTSVPHSKTLQSLCNHLSLDSIYVYDEDGYTIATNTGNWFFSISRDPKDQSYEFLKVLDGKVDEYIQGVRVDDLGNPGQYIGVQFTYYITQDPDGSTRYISRSEFEEMARNRGEGDPVSVEECRSMLQIGLDSQLTSTLLSTADDPTYSAVIPGGGFFLTFDTSEEHRCIYSPYEAQIGMAAKDLDIPESAFFHNVFCDYTRMNGESYFDYVRYVDGSYVATFIPSSGIYRDRLPISLLTSAISFVLLLVLSCSVIFTTDEEEVLYAAENGKPGKIRPTFFEVKLPTGKRLSTTDAAARWSTDSLPWSERSAEQKLRLLISIAAGMFLLYISYTVIRANALFDRDSIVLYILDGVWDRGLNIFALSACGLIILATSIGIVICHIPFRLLTFVMGARTETITRLLLSVIKYGCGIGALFYCLYLLGVDSTGLIASASVLSLVIGLGAQSLITDIIAGLFIVFEGTFRVGDIITVQGFRGTVMDISLRTTKVLAVDGNISIFNNSDIKGVLNMTKQASYAFVTPSIEYGQDIDYVEAVLKRELPKLKRKDPRILDGPNYLGVQKLGESGVELLITCKCNEEDFKTLTRSLNRSILKIFYQNGINVPFPNVTVSQLNMEGRKTMADFKEEKPRQKKQSETPPAAQP